MTTPKTELPGCPNKTPGCDGTGWVANCVLCGEHICVVWAAVWNPSDETCRCLACVGAQFDPADERRSARKNMLDGDPRWEKDEDEER